MIAQQLADELAAAVQPLAGLLGVDLAQILVDRINQSADRLARQLDDPSAGPDVARDLMSAIWGPAMEPDDPAYWRTPLGSSIAGAIASVQDGTVSHAHAAQILGVTRGTIAQMTARGQLSSGRNGIPVAEVLGLAAKRGRTRPVEAP